MSENANDKPNEQIPASAAADEGTLGRRLFFFKAAAVLGGAAAISAATAVGTATEAQAQRCTDRDRGDQRGRGRWCRRRSRVCRDNDPYDPRTYRC